MKILIIEDNTQLLDLIQESLTNEKYLCETANDYPLACEKVNLYQYDIAIIDINLPSGNGLDIIRELKKQTNNTGIIVISARNSLDNKIEGLELGADDYITKPFDMAELVARVKSLIRRQHFSGNMHINFGDIEIDPNNRSVFVKGTKVEFTKSEYDILIFFISNKSRVLTRENIAEHIWGDNMDMADSFDFIYSHVKNIRKKITALGASDPIKAIYGIGYKFTIDETY